MEHLPLTLVLFLVGLVATQQLDHLRAYRSSDTPKRVKRDAAATEQHREFVEEKLAQQSQALEHLIKLAQTSEELTNRLIENLAKVGEKPKLPEKIEGPKSTRRSNSEVEKETVNLADTVKVKVKEVMDPVVEYVKTVPKAGLLARRLLLNRFKKEEDAVPLVERRGKGNRANKTVLEDLPEDTRRSFKSKLYQVPSQLGLVQAPPARPEGNPESPWCKEALLCKKDHKPVCGYDTGYGYGRFEDMCHLFQVNCYWHYKFTLAPLACRPAL